MKHESLYVIALLATILMVASRVLDQINHILPVLLGSTGF